MRNVFKIFRRDAEKIWSNVVAVVVIMGLSVLPSLYAWFNILSNWDPYGPESTSHLKVAVVNEDEGGRSGRRQTQYWKYRHRQIEGERIHRLAVCRKQRESQGRRYERGVLCRIGH